MRRLGLVRISPSVREAVVVGFRGGSPGPSIAVSTSAIVIELADCAS